MDENKNKTVDYADSAPKRDDINNNADDIDIEVKTNEVDKNGEEKKDDSVVIAKSKLALIKKLLSNIKENSDKLSSVLSIFISEEDEALIGIGQAADDGFNMEKGESEEGKIIEGVFDGENMIGSEGKQYSIPANYASKSKLVEGDILKLTITAKGTFVYKQISPIERMRVVGRLERESDGNYYASADGKRWRVLTASITYFKGEPGDEIIVLIPKTGGSKWGAVDNIIRDRGMESL